MMEAIDTVMSDKQLRNTAIEYSVLGVFEDIFGQAAKAMLRTQAEISFPKGEKQGIDKGRKEVVEFVDAHTTTDDWDGWQEAKEEWGL